jgi:hypothetical protein
MASAPVWQRGRRGLLGWSLGTLAAPLLVLPLGAASGCYDFTYVEPAGDAGAPPTGDGDSTACVAEVSYCGGDRLVGAADTLYRCAADGGGALVKKCASGCIPDAGGGRCAPPASPCKIGGAYCGGDKLDGDPNVLYRCASGAPALIEPCAKGCRVMPAGTDDECVR